MCYLFLAIGFTVLVFHGQNGVHGTYTPSGARSTTPSYSKVVVHRKTATWLEGLETCRKQNSTMLCYTKASHVSQAAAELTFFAFPRMWILNRNCSETISEPNLSIDLKNLNMTRAQVSYVSQHNFHKEAETQKLPFICFTNVTSAIVPSSLLRAPEMKVAALEETTKSTKSLETTTGESPTANPTKEVKNVADIFEGTPYSYNCATDWQRAKESCEACKRCKWCKKDVLNECELCSFQDKDCEERITSTTCEYGGRLACPRIIDKESLLSIRDIIEQIPHEGDQVTFWFGGEKCHTNHQTIIFYLDSNLHQVHEQHLVPLPALCEELVDTQTETPTITSSATTIITTSSATATTITAATTTKTTKITTKTTTSTPISIITTTPVTTSTPTSTTIKETICCPSKTVRGITWKAKCDNSGYVYEDCPDSAKGEAKWFCDTATGKWEPDRPDLENCTSSFITDLDTNVNRSNVAEALNLLGKHNPVYGGDVVGIGKILTEVVVNVRQFIDSAKDPVAKKDLAVNITEKVVSLGDNMLTNKAVWLDLPQISRTKAATDLLKNGEDTAFQCAHNLDTNQTQSFQKKRLVLQVMKNQKGVFENGLTLPQPTQESSITTSTFVLPPGFEDSLDNSQYTVVVFFEYKDLADLLVGNQLEESVNSTSISAVNSPVVSVSLNENQAKVTLDKEATFLLRHSNQNADKPVCAFWNFTSLSWDSEGCRVVETNDSFTKCACDHLTNFAVLMDIHGALDSLSEMEQKVLQTITQIGCIISIVFLSATIVVTTVYRALWGMRNSVHRNLCICLLIAEVLFVAAGARTETKVFCAVIAGLLHYFFTAAFCWMLLEAVLIYLLLYKVFSPKKSYTQRFYAVGYGVPLMIVGISAAVRPSGYGTEVACWLSREHGFRWSFVGPVAVILAVNFVALAFALHVAARTSKRMNQKTGPPVSRAWILGGLTLVPLLGSTWIVGFVLLNNDSVLIYTFTILNSLQGLAIFIVLCLMNQSSRKCLIKSFGKYTSFTSSMTSSSNRSTTQSDVRRQSRRSSKCSRSNSSPTSPDPLVSPQQTPIKRNPWSFGPRFLRSISGRFDVSSGEHTDNSDICYSASVGDNPSVMLKQKVKHELSV